MSATLRAVRAELAEQARTPAPGPAFGEQVMDAVHRVLPFDGYALIGLDPCTGMRSNAFSRNGLDGVAARLAVNEAIEHDANRYRDLATAETPVGLLMLDDPAHPRSPRMHEIVRPAGFTSELRMVLRGAGRVWGAVVLFRSERRRSFSEVDVAAALSLADPLGEAVRRYPLRRVADVPDPLPPGVVLLDAKNRVTTSSAEARAWLDDLRPGGRDEMSQADFFRLVYDIGFAARREVPDRLPTPQCCLRTTSGRWLHMHGVNPMDSAGDVVVVLQPAALGQILPAVAAWLRLTPRETEVLNLVARGMAAQTMARRLQRSVLTVNDHLAAIYRKAGVSGRSELLATLT